MPASPVPTYSQPHLPSPKKRAALYLHVSKRDGDQTEENQRRQLHCFLEQEGYDLARPDGSLREFVDREFGRKGRRERSAFSAVFEAAERREFDTLVFWSLIGSAVRASARQSPTSSSSRRSAPVPVLHRAVPLDRE
ncbi:MAG: hypothetical protein Rubg2KO_16180 [Rubricoccaceae bacterium]